MRDIDRDRKIVLKGLKDYLSIEVIRSNQTGEIPSYPYGSYTITTPASASKGTWSTYEDGIDRIPITQTWSITFQSDNYSEVLSIAMKAREWFEHVGRIYLNDNDIIVQSVTGLTNRDNLLTVEYEYRLGFDVVFWALSETENIGEQAGYIETATINGQEVEAGPTDEELNAMLERRLTGR